jgi:hypothetical protein
VTCELVSAMTYRMYGAFIASLGAVALILAANEAFARSGVAPGPAHGRGFARPSVAPFLRHHHRGNNIGAFWLGEGFFSEPSYGAPTADFAQPMSRDMHYTYTNDVPWDWVHRFPPAVTPSERAYVPECPAQTVTVPGNDGQERTVNIVRCY